MRHRLHTRHIGLACGLALALFQADATAKPVHGNLHGHAAGSVNHTGDRDALVKRGEVSVGAALWREATSCRTFSLTGDASFFVGDEGQFTSGKESASLCISKTLEGVDVVFLDLRHTLEWDYKPSLFTPRSFLRRRYRQHTIDLLWGALDTSIGNTQRISALGFSPHFSLANQDVDGARVYQVNWGVGFMLLGWRNDAEDAPVASGDFLMIDFGGVVVGDVDTSLTTFTPFALKSIALWGGAKMDFAVNWQDGGPSEYEEIDGHSRSLLGADVNVFWTGERKSAGGALSRKLRVTFDSELTKDLRATGWLSATRKLANGATLETTLRAFLARTYTIPRPEVQQPAQTDHTGGLGVDLLARWRVWTLSLSTEAGKSFYTRIDDAPTPQAEFGVQAVVRLGFELGDHNDPDG